ncbi:creatininase family protein [Nocardia macrotermitis]|uniref:Putative mycofactocin system creatinine amidohydrolase family protein MftE n=1 Tax=Nocardia macrotermitis TaxID=2585198 RepID=A0A7K0CY07_9NOCA|nr:creatininase family protein [Nocardia macrotermitis]MQY18390.1 putative mycofactocin system creatinine amidohydrolase family protein MftE [Nocardia macrotermitis]
MTLHTRQFADLSTTEVGASLNRDSVLVLPTGAIEPHGPHLPLRTDLVVAEAVAAAGVERAVAEGTDAWLLPGLGYTKSDEHSHFPGAMWISADTLMRTLIDLGRSIAATPARRLLFVNCHGGNSALLEVALRELRRRFDLQTFLYARSANPGPTEEGFGIHAGWAETSVMLHLRPDLVDMSLAKAAVPHALTEYKEIGFGKPVRFGWLADDFDESGVIGDPTGADAAIGAELFGASVDGLVQALPEVARFDPGRVRR